MALSPFQRDICRLLAAGWRASGESYVAGGAALGVALATARISRDLDIFHDSTEAVARSWDRDRAALAQAGFAIELVRERPGFVEALVRRADDVVVMEWARDSAFRFFPLVEHPELGLSLHPVDLATNKVLAMISRAEVRDWLDVIDAELRLQPFGFLAWAAAGKDPGFSPAGIVGHARRTSRYTDDEFAQLAFEGPAPRAADLAATWHDALRRADAIIEALPASHAGELVLTDGAELFTGTGDALSRALREDTLRFHPGRLGGAWPAFRSR